MNEMITKFMDVEKFDAVAKVKAVAVNNIIDKWNSNKERVQESGQDYKDIFANFWMNCIDCALSDLILNGAYECSDDEYEERIQFLAECVDYEIRDAFKRKIDVHEARKVMYPHLA